MSKRKVVNRGSFLGKKKSKVNIVNLEEFGRKAIILGGVSALITGSGFMMLVLLELILRAFSISILNVSLGELLTFFCGGFALITMGYMITNSMVNEKCV